jgi:PTH1 family peptidyl-tRNA hydrolase
VATDALIVGLGNPGKEYERTRHNIGFMAVTAFAHTYGMRFSGKRMQAELASGIAEGRAVVVARPQTYMNASGTSVAQLVHWYRVPTRRTLIVYDEVDLPFGTLRYRPTGSSAGHKGIGSIIQALSTSDIPRLRLGIGRPTGGGKAMGHVLKTFAPSERELLEKEILPAAVEAIELFLTRDDPEEIMRTVNAPRAISQQPAASSQQAEPRRGA